MKQVIAAICLVIAAAAFCLAQVSLAPSASAPTSKTMALKCGNLFDGRGDSLRKNVVIVVEDGKIKDIAATAPAGADLVDLSRSTCLPGLMDTHTHVLLRGSM